MGSNGRGKKKDALLQVEVGANDQDDPVIFVSSAKDGRVIVALTIPHSTLRSYILEHGGKMTPLDALNEILKTSFDAILDSIAEFVDVDKKK